MVGEGEVQGIIGGSACLNCSGTVVNFVAAVVKCFVAVVIGLMAVVNSLAAVVIAIKTVVTHRHVRSLAGSRSTGEVQGIIGGSACLNCSGTVVNSLAAVVKCCVAVVIRLMAVVKCYAAVVIAAKTVVTHRHVRNLARSRSTERSSRDNWWKCMLKL